MDQERSRVAIVTGGTRGIGGAISLMMARNGITVVAVFRSDRTRAASFEIEMKKICANSRVVQGDVSIRQDVRRIVTAVVEEHNQIDILVNNAGMFEFRSIENIDEAFINQIIDTNFKSQLFMIQECVPHMKEGKFGRIINASSISGATADVGLVGYGCSKAAVDMMTRIAAAELAPFNITVNAYAPGIIHTDLTDEMIRLRGEIQKKQIPLQRFGTCDEVASLVAFLASDEASYITGEIIGIDGGMLKVQNPIRAYQEKETS